MVLFTGDSCLRRSCCYRSLTSSSTQTQDQTLSGSKTALLRKWFFASCLSGHYYGGVNSWVEGDCKELQAWVETGVVPGHVENFDADFVRA